MSQTTQTSPARIANAPRGPMGRPGGGHGGMMGGAGLPAEKSLNFWGHIG